MSWPLPQDFNEAIQNPSSAFSDPELKAGQPVVGPQGLPLPRSGNFADVYQIRSADGRDWAVKCFTRPVTGLEERYAKVEEALDRAGLPFTVGFTFQTNGIRVRGEGRPVLRMEWVDGLLLNQVARDQAASPKVLDALSQMWSRLAKRLREARIAHADLQHGNVLLVPGSRVGSYGLKLIDYDGMYVPALANKPSGESGHPNYQHPFRAAKQVYSPDLDRFPHLVIATALKGLAVFGPTLWERFDTGDNMLFTDEDFRAPASSKLMRELWLSCHPGIQALVGHLAIACGKSIPQTPWVDHIAPDGIVVPLNPTQMSEAETALGLAPVVVGGWAGPNSPTKPPGTATRVTPLPAQNILSIDEEPSQDHDFDAFPRNSSRSQRNSRRPQPTNKQTISAGLVVAILAGMVFVGGSITTAILLLRGKKPDETAQVKVNELVEQTDRPAKDAPFLPDRSGPQPSDRETPFLPDISGPQPSDRDAPSLLDKYGPKPPVSAVPSLPEKDLTKPPETAVPSPPIQGPRTAVPSPPIQGPRTLASLPQLRIKWDCPLGAEGKIESTAFNSDGSRLVAIWKRRNEVSIVNAADGAAVGSFADHTGQPIGVCRLADGRMVTLDLADPFAIVWDPVTQRPVGKLQVTPIPNGSLPVVFQISPDGRYAVTGRAGRDKSPVIRGVRPNPDQGNVSITETETGRQVATFEYMTGIIRFTTDGTRLVVAEDSGRVRTFRPPASDPETSWAAPPGRLTRVMAIPGDGRWVAFWGSATANNRGPRVHDTQTGAFLTTFAISTAVGLAGAASADGKWLAVSYSNGPRGRAFVLVDTTIWAPVAAAVLPDTHNFTHDGTVHFSPDGSTLVAVRGDFAVRAFEIPRGGGVIAPPKQNALDPKQNALDAPRPVLKSVWAKKVAFGPDRGTIAFDRTGQLILLGGSNQFGLKIYSVANGGHITGHGWGPNTPVTRFISLEGQKIGWYQPSTNSGSHRTIKGGQPVEFLRPPASADLANTTLYFSPDTQFLAVGKNGITTVGKPDPVPFQVYQLPTNEVVKGVWTGGSIHFTGDSSRVLVAEGTGKFRWYKLPSGEAEGECTISGDLLSPTSRVLAMSDDGKIVFYSGRAPGATQAFHLIDGQTGQLIRTLAQGNQYTADPDLDLGSRDGRMFILRVTSASGMSVDVFDGLSGTVVARLQLPEGATGIPVASISPDGRRVAVYVHETGDLLTYDLGELAAAVAPVRKEPMPTTTKPAAVARVPVPDDEAIAKADEKVRGVFKEEFARKSAAEKKALAVKLIQIAEETANDPAERYALVRDARDLAVEANDPVLAIQAIDGIARWFVIDEHRLKLEVFEKLAGGTASSTTLRVVAEQALTCSEEAATADDYEIATKLAQFAASAARRGGLIGGVIEDADHRVAQTRKAAEAFAAVKSALDKLKTDPNDPGANLAVGRYRCLARGQWDEGVTHLLKGNHPDLQAAAEEELKALKTGLPDVKVADCWWDFAQTATADERRPAEARARYWYARALPGLMGLSRARAETRLAFTLNGVEYRPGLVAEFLAKDITLLKGKKGRVDSVVDFSPGEFAESGRPASDIFVKWTGVVVVTRPGRYKLIADTRDPVKVKVNGKVLFDTSVMKGAKTEAVVMLTDRPMTLQVEFSAKSNKLHTIRLNWVPPGSDVEELIPAEFFFHDRKAEAIIGK